MRTAIVLVMLSGCSIAFMERAPELSTVKPGQQVYCTASRGFAVWDFANAVTGAAAILVVREAYAESDVIVTEDVADAANLWGLLLAGSAVLHAASGIYGLREAGRCEDARRIAGPSATPAPVVTPERPPGF